MNEGDRVHYTRSHWAWMVNAGKAQPGDERREKTGTVLAVSSGTALVKWDGLGRPWPFKTRVEPTVWEPTVHLLENLEVAQ
jgi:hypothetical protein